MVREVCLIVEDHPLTAAGLSASISDAFPQYDVDVVHSIEKAMAFLQSCAISISGIVMLDMQLKDGTGLEILTTIRDRGLALRGIVVSGSSKQIDIASARALGARAFVPKSADPDFVLHAVRIVSAGGECYLPSDSDSIGQYAASEFQKAVDQFSATQRRILDLMVGGLNNKEIASKVDRSDGYVRNVVQIIYKNLGLKSRGQLMVAARETGYRPKT